MIFISNKKRLIVILFLVIFGILLFSVTKIYEKRLISKDNVDVINSYAPFKKVK